MGHAAGDVVLKEVSQRLRSDLRPYDVVGRYGGEEFLLILPGCDLVVGARRAEEIRTRVENSRISTPAGGASVTISMGVTVTSSLRGYTAADCLQEADISLYSAKNNGRNRVEIFSAAAKHAKAR